MVTEKLLELGFKMVNENLYQLVNERHETTITYEFKNEYENGVLKVYNETGLIREYDAKSETMEFFIGFMLTL